MMICFYIAQIGFTKKLFIANENGYCQKILDLIDDIMKDEPTRFSIEIEKKLRMLITDWERDYGKGKNSIDFVLQKYL